MAQSHSEGWDVAQLERASQERRAARAREDAAKPDPREYALSRLRATGHGKRLAARDLEVTPAGNVIARAANPKPLRVNGTKPPRAPARPASSGPSLARRVLGGAADVPVSASRAVGGAVTGGDTAVGRLLGAVIAGAIALEIASLVTGRFFNFDLGAPWHGGKPAAPSTITPATSAAVGSALPVFQGMPAKSAPAAPLVALGVPPSSAPIRRTF